MTTQQEHCRTWDDTWLRIQTEAVQVGFRAKQPQNNGWRIAFRGENQRFADCLNPSCGGIILLMSSLIFGNNR